MRKNLPFTSVAGEEGGIGGGLVHSVMTQSHPTVMTAPEEVRVVQNSTKVGDVFNSEHNRFTK